MRYPAPDAQVDYWTGYDDHSGTGPIPDPRFPHFDYSLLLEGFMKVISRIASITRRAVVCTATQRGSTNSAPLALPPALRSMPEVTDIDTMTGWKQHALH